MKNIIAAAALATLVAGSAQAQPAQPAPGPNGKCLWSSMIDHTVVAKDTRSIVFHMRDGTAWRTTMPAACTSLALYGFTFVTHTDEVCGGQGIVIPHTGQVCSLGAFVPETTHS
jgi:hypothetical protein